jgi:protein AFG1
MMNTVMKNMDAQHRVARGPLQTGPVTAAYERKVDAGEVRRDAAQIALAAKLDALHESLGSLPPVPVRTAQPTESRSPGSSSLLVLLQRARSSLRKKFHLWSFGLPPRGIYIHGTVGVGKSFLMDLFYASVNAPDDARRNSDGHRLNHAKITKRRVHFHEFMLEVHQRIFLYKQKHPRDDAIPIIAQQLAQEAQLLCFDEFQVTDVADAMILKRLFLSLLDLNVVAVATSNRSPDTLYEGGINRSLFLPFVELLKQRFDITSMEDSAKDYRLETRADGQSYFWSNKDAHGDSDSNMQAQLNEIFGGTASETAAEVIPVHFGRTVQIARSNDRCAWFNFSELCYQPLGAADYISLCERFSVLIIDKVPQLNAHSLDETRRFVTLIDVCYESRTRLVIAAQVPLNELFVDFEAQTESSDGNEELIVSEKGGNSSSFATTMIRTKEGEYYEWSATGLTGASLAQLSGANDLAFSFRRALSRLVEMGGKEWGRQ